MIPTGTFTMLYMFVLLAVAAICIHRGLNKSIAIVLILNWVATRAVMVNGGEYIPALVAIVDFASLAVLAWGKSKPSHLVAILFLPMIGGYLLAEYGITTPAVMWGISEIFGYAQIIVMGSGLVGMAYWSRLNIGFIGRWHHHNAGGVQNFTDGSNQERH